MAKKKETQETAVETVEKVETPETVETSEEVPVKKTRTRTKKVKEESAAEENETSADFIFYGFVQGIKIADTSIGECPLHVLGVSFFRDSPITLLIQVRRELFGIDVLGDDYALFIQ